jgi:multiple sugar transport system ATP-binding protein
VASVTYDHVTKRFGEVVAVDDFCLEVKDEEFLVLVGPSGCGKTTCLRMLAGLEQATEGEIFIGDRMVNDVAPKDRDIAMVFQNYALYPHKNVFDNMAYGLKLRGMKKPEINQRVEKAAGDLGVDQLLGRKPKELSGGQQQRVALGRAIVREPLVFLMDEPLSNLDAQLRVDARAMLIRLHQEVGTTFIYVTHDQVEAMTMGERIAVMSEGICQQLDTPQNLYDHPLCRQVHRQPFDELLRRRNQGVSRRDVYRHGLLPSPDTCRKGAIGSLAAGQEGHIRDPSRAHSRQAVLTARTSRCSGNHNGGRGGSHGI